MPVKSVREMSPLQRRHYSLEARVFRATLMGGVVLGFALLLVGLGLYSVSLTQQFVSHAFYLSQNAAQSAKRGTDGVGFSQQVMEVYHGLSDEERAEMGTEAYRGHFAELRQSETYSLLMHMMPGFSQSEDVSDVYLAMYDEGDGALVYIADPVGQNRYEAGDWEPVEVREASKFLNWNGEGMLYDIRKTERYGWLCTAGTPIRNEAGEICCFALVDFTVENILAGLHIYGVRITVALILVIALITWLLIRHMRKTLINPINEIAEAAQEYVKDRRDGVKDLDHFAILNIRTGDEVENLSLVMADMEHDLNDYEENLTRATAEKERISTELGLAARIQENMLPSQFPAFPDRFEFDLYASMDPAREVGGDFYDFFLIDEDHLCLVIADVSGKGIPAALFMMASKIIIANSAKMGKSPAQILDDTNAAICPKNREKMFVTVWLGILELSTGKLTAANAGHEYPVLKKPNGRFEMFKDKHGLVIGVTSLSRYKEYELQLEPGSKLFVYTDGVPEATDAEKNLFGTERMLAALNEEPEAPPEEILGHVRRAVDAFVRDAEQFDDLTMLCLELEETRGASPERS